MTKPRASHAASNLCCREKMLMFYVACAEIPLAPSQPYHKHQPARTHGTIKYQHPQRTVHPLSSLPTTDVVAPTWTCSRLLGVVPVWAGLSVTLGTDATMLGCEPGEQVRLLLEPRFDDDDTTVDEGSELKVNAEDVVSRAAPATTAVAMALRLTWHFVMTKAQETERGGGGSSSRTGQTEQGDGTLSRNGK